MTAAAVGRDRLTTGRRGCRDPPKGRQDLLAAPAGTMASQGRIAGPRLEHFADGLDLTCGDQSVLLTSDPRQESPLGDRLDARSIPLAMNRARSAGSGAPQRHAVLEFPDQAHHQKSIKFSRSGPVT